MDVKKSLLMLAVLVLLAGSVFFLQPAGQVSGRSFTLLEFNTMVGVPKAYTGAANPVRGLAGGGLPWVIGSANGELNSSGSLELKFTGLALDPNDPTVIARGLAGVNPIASMMAVVSCQTVDSTGAAVVTNVATAPFAVTTGAVSAGGGKGHVEARLALPKPCIGPIVFVTSTGSAWFAATGN
jgi:hypothetical protein